MMDMDMDLDMDFDMDFNLIIKKKSIFFYN